MLVPVFLPNLGCYSRCIYCDQSYIVDLKNENLKDYIDRALRKEGPFEVGLYGGNILGMDKVQLQSILRLFDPYLEKISRIRLSTKPVRPEGEVLDVIHLLQTYKVEIFELGIPIFDDGILNFLQRNHTVKDLEDMYKYLRESGFKVALQVMVGLPHETRIHVVETVKRILELKPEYIRIYPLVIIKGTPMERMLFDGKINLVDFEEVKKRTAYIYASAAINGIMTLKIGLTDNEALRKNTVGGFYHPSFGYLVKCYIFWEALKGAMLKYRINGKTDLIINEENIAYFYGYKGENRRALETLGISLKKTDPSLDSWEFVLIREDGSEVKGKILEVFLESLSFFPQT
ncbi:MAG: radical SAM protein [Desulfobacterota bacterium]|nr:radical SAM protein [Thermodesulfobacteriota bacterium]